MATPTASTITTSFQKKYTVTAAQIAAIGAATSGNVYIDTVPAGSLVGPVFWKHNTAVVGASVSAATARVTTTNNNYGSGALDVFAAPSATGYILDVTPKMESYGAATVINLAMTTTGANASVVTAGSIDVWFDVRPLK